MVLYLLWVGDPSESMDEMGYLALLELGRDVWVNDFCQETFSFSLTVCYTPTNYFRDEILIGSKFSDVRPKCFGQFQE